MKMTPSPAALAIGLLLGAALTARPSTAQPAWGGYGGNAQHTAVSSVASQSLGQIVWQTPVDLHPPYTGGGSLLIHYGSPLVTALNTVVIPVKTGVTDTFRVEARRGGDGTLLWQYDADYTLPPHNWVPSYSPVLTPGGRLYIPGGGGTVLYTNSVDSAGTPTFARVAFYGNANYNSNPASFNSDMQICTPLTSDAAGNIFFGYRALGANPLGIVDGIARIGANGVNSYVTATAATGGLGVNALMNCAPALSNDGLTLYVGIRRPTVSRGYLVALNAATLATTAKVLLIEPKASNQATLTNNGTASPMVAPDGKVYFGVLDNPAFSNNQRGWLLGFTSALSPVGAPGAFGWDDTPSIVPASSVPSYAGGSAYLLMVKYNNYAGAGSGDGVNKIAILDPNDSQLDAVSGINVMKEVLVQAGVTPDPEQFPTYPNAVKEWCINSAVMDPQTNSILAGSEDGKLYRWDLTTNTFSQSIVLTPGLGEAYTPTLIGRDGRVYAINNATLFSVGVAALTVDPVDGSRGLTLSPGRPNPFNHSTSLRFSVAQAGRARLDILDAAGRSVARLIAAEVPAGEHVVEWDGRAAGGHRCAAGIYFARLSSEAGAVSRRLVLTR